jgi:hypothetical protein
MRTGTVIEVALTWEQIKKICEILAECGQSALIVPFESACFAEESRQRDEEEFGLNMWGP